MTREELFKELDAAARHNLSYAGLRRYDRRKAELCGNQSRVPGVEEYLAIHDIEAILRGFIWEEIEIEMEEDSPSATYTSSTP